jgi:hypothetical protein
MKEPCACSNLDWRDCDMTAEHHPNCEMAQAVCANADSVFGWPGWCADFYLARRLNMPPQDITDEIRRLYPKLYADAVQFEGGVDTVYFKAITKSVLSPSLKLQIENLICPACKAAGVLREEPNRYHTNKEMLYCRFVRCTGHFSLGDTIEEAIDNWGKK